MPVVDDLFIKLGYKYDAKEMEKFNDLAENTGKILKVGSLAVIGLATSFTLLFSKLSANALAQDRFGKSIDVSRESIAAFARTSNELTGNEGTAGGLLSTFDGITNSMNAGKSQSDEFLRAIATLGISFSQFKSSTPEENLLNMAEGFQGLNEDSKDVITSLLGLDSAQRNLFQGLTREKFKANTPAAADLASIERFDKLLKDLKQTFDDSIITFGTPLFEKLIPMFETLNKNMPDIIEFAGQATDAFVSLGEAIGESIGFAVVTINDFIGILDNLGSSIGTGIFDIQSTVENFFSPSTVPSIGGDASSNVTNSSSVSQKFDIQITSDNPQAVANEIRRVSQEQMSQANKNLSSPVRN